MEDGAPVGGKLFVVGPSWSVVSSGGHLESNNCLSSSQMQHHFSVVTKEAACLTDGISVEGMVVHRAECRPIVSEDYMKIKRLQIESVKPQRLSQQLDRAITTVFKPVANHDFNVEFEKKKKSEGKMVRAERQVVMDMLFSAFEKHQYYSFKDLVDITKQPVTYLKEIMREIGICNRKGAHKSNWELKPEYQHYRPAEEEEEEKEDS
ncbi:General transcription factor IIF subunit 2 [Oryzias melastigma]|uniref:General transcription factor IIF subunit 2 n=1 Tax=Oryzias melastigma TaxID=30732 RepID=A0A834FS07_ORYME|nr:General transcription factor IIF subunit 2 [Oryzias melastigma]